MGAIFKRSQIFFHKFTFAVYVILPYPDFMKKMQPVHRYAAYVLFGIVLAVVIGASLKNEPLSPSSQEQSLIIVEQNSEDRPSSPVVDNLNFADEEEFVDITESLSNKTSIESESKIIIDESSLIDEIGQVADNETIWSDPFFPFSDVALSEAPKEVVTPVEQKGRIAIIIDDMGIDVANSYAMMDMQGPFTLAFLPYAEKINSQTEFARKNHHALMIHMPMEAMNGIMMDTPGLLKLAATPDLFQEQLEFNLGKMKGYTGLNNHMGSLLTQDEGKMTLLMRTLKEEGYYFVDSRTINTSIAADIAAREGVPYLVRDVFLDHDPSLEGVRKALHHAEDVAARKGIAIAIGHPKTNTVQAIREWIPTLKAKGFDLVTVDELIEDAYPEFTIKESDDLSLIAAPHQDHITVLSIFD
jgi:polysaccharide deacetylase 2 family uncharacterized protein YibQ